MARTAARPLPLTAPGVARPPAGFTPADFEGAYPGLGYFDSLGVQADGGVCVATILAGGISTFWPDTKKFEHTPLPDLIVTNICWGAKDMKTAFVTMSSTGNPRYLTFLYLLTPLTPSPLLVTLIPTVTPGAPLICGHIHGRTNLKTT